MTAKIASAPISWGIIEVPDWGMQLEVDRVLGEMRELGITATEFGSDGFLPDDGQEQLRVLQHYDLTPVGGFFPTLLHRAEHDPLPEIRKALDNYAELGAEVLVLAAETGESGYDTRPELSVDEWQTLLDNINRAVEAAAETPVTLTLHPHMGTIVQTPEETRRVIDGSAIGICLDTGHYALGGGDSLALVRECAERVTHVHLKDVSFAVAERVKNGEIDYREGCKRGMYQPLGAGDARVREVIEALEAGGYGGWYVLEQDCVIENEADARRAYDDSRRSLAFVHDLLA